MLKVQGEPRVHIISLTNIWGHNIIRKTYRDCIVLMDRWVGKAAMTLQWARSTHRRHYSRGQQTGRSHQLVNKQQVNWVLKRKKSNGTFNEMILRFGDGRGARMDLVEQSLVRGQLMYPSFKPNPEASRHSNVMIGRYLHERHNSGSTYHPVPWPVLCTIQILNACQKVRLVDILIVGFHFLDELSCVVKYLSKCSAGKSICQRNIDQPLLTVLLPPSAHSVTWASYGFPYAWTIPTPLSLPHSQVSTDSALFTHKFMAEKPSQNRLDLCLITLDLHAGQCITAEATECSLLAAPPPTELMFALWGTRHST